jgi:hypothetical protein
MTRILRNRSRSIGEPGAEPISGWLPCLGFEWHREPLSVTLALAAMRTLLTCWLVLLFASFAVSVLGLTWVQLRLTRAYGWRVFRTRSALNLYWHGLGPFERWLIWPGLIAFFLTLVGGTLLHFFNRT